MFKIPQKADSSFANIFPPGPGYNTNTPGLQVWTLYQTLPALSRAEENISGKKYSMNWPLIFLMKSYIDTGSADALFQW